MQASAGWLTASLCLALLPHDSSAQCAAPVVENQHPAGACVEGSQIAEFGVCTPQCLQGFVSRGTWRPENGGLVCVYGRLNPSTFTCVGMNCTEPEGVEFGAEEENETNCVNGSLVAHGSSCHVRCAHGYELTTDSPRVLDCYGGVLTPSTFECQGKSCPVSQMSLIERVHSRSPCSYNFKEFGHGYVCLPQCQEGWHPNVSRIKCDRGNFISTFECLGDPCPAPANIRDAELVPCREGMSAQHGGVCTPVCRDGYFANHLSIPCYAGYFRAPFLFNCTGNPCSAPWYIPGAVSPTNGSNVSRIVFDEIVWEYTPPHSRTCREGTLISHEGWCTPQCLPGYVVEIEGNVNELQCNLGVLNPPSFTCTGQPCQAPEGIADARLLTCREGATLAHGGNCTTVCDYGFTPNIDVLRCNATVLDPPNFTCIPGPCEVPSGIPNQATNACLEGGPSLSDGSVCTPQCQPGFVPSATKLHCYGQQLRPSSFTCLQASLVNATTHLGDVTSQGFTAHMTIASLSPGWAVSCHQDASGQRDARCGVLLSSASSPLRQGPRSNLTTFEVDGLVLAAMGAEKVVACYNTRDGASCSLLELGVGAVMDQGANLQVSTQPTYHLSMAALAGQRVVLCFQQGIDAFACQVLTASSGGVLSGSAPMLSRPGTAAGMAMAGLSNDEVLLCMIVATKNRSLDCFVLKAAGSSLSISSAKALEVQAAFLAASELAPGKVLLCYSDWSRGSAASCMALEKRMASADPLVVVGRVEAATGFTRHLALTGLGNFSALLCYERKGLVSACEDFDKNCDAWASTGECVIGVNAHVVRPLCPRACGLCTQAGSSRGQCTVVRHLSSVQMMAGPAVVFNDAVTWNIKVASVASDTALVCFSDSSHRELGRCRTIWGKRNWIEGLARLCPIGERHCIGAVPPRLGCDAACSGQVQCSLELESAKEPDCVP
eukprot:TRINITY_DN20988_c0_g1_i1.p1 TRINITY_DN20988_c0_g1~~TRINITY_DN20988_c0_g1_i1.p1  ORF type:complete len:974 (-),score=82.64 TRINITY_DN20988_c0_g1_i1:159-2993(-)